MSCSMGSQRHTVLIVPRSVDVYRILKFRLVAKRMIVSKLPMASCYCLEQIYFAKQGFYLQQQYSNSQ
jgi:hypothetical protein